MRGRSLAIKLAMIGGGLLLSGCRAVDVGVRTGVDDDNIMVGSSIFGLPDAVYGVRVNLIGSDSGCTIYGLETGLFCGGSIQGIQIGALRAGAPSGNGIQVALNNTVSYGHLMQVGVWNTASDGGNCQIGVWNTASDGGACQIGLLNKAGNADGLQIGLLNESPNSWIRFMPFINVVISNGEATPEAPAEIIIVEEDFDDVQAAKADMVRAKLEAKAEAARAKAAKYEAKAAELEAAADAL